MLRLCWTTSSKYFWYVLWINYRNVVLCWCHHVLTKQLSMHPVKTLGHRGQVIIIICKESLDFSQRKKKTCDHAVPGTCGDTFHGQTAYPSKHSNHRITVKHTIASVIAWPWLRWSTLNLNHLECAFALPCLLLVFVHLSPCQQHTFRCLFNSWILPLSDTFLSNQNFKFRGILEI